MSTPGDPITPRNPLVVNARGKLVLAVFHTLVFAFMAYQAISFRMQARPFPLSMGTLGVVIGIAAVVLYTRRLLVLSRELPPVSAREAPGGDSSATTPTTSADGAATDGPAPARDLQAIAEEIRSGGAEEIDVRTAAAFFGWWVAYPVLLFAVGLTLATLVFVTGYWRAVVKGSWPRSVLVAVVLVVLMLVVQSLLNLRVPGGYLIGDLPFGLV